MPATPYSVVRRRREQRHTRLVALGYADYREYLRSPHWQSVKARYRASDQPQDCICGEVDGLQLHHLTYERIGAEDMSDLTLLCKPCHAMIHTLERRGEIGLDFAGFISEQRAERYKAAQRTVEPLTVRTEDRAKHVIAKLRVVAEEARGSRVNIDSHLHAIDQLLETARRRLLSQVGA